MQKPECLLPDEEDGDSGGIGNIPKDKTTCSKNLLILSQLKKEKHYLCLLELKFLTFLYLIHYV
jgi:hypothetical protein